MLLGSKSKYRYIMESKRILTIHDLSSYGTASLGVAIPVLSAFGHEVVALPTVILSSTTDIDRDPIALETTDWMRQVIQRWKEYKVNFDAVYTGWLGDPKQVDLLIELCENSLHERAIVVIDPVLGDGGELYPSQQELLIEMSKLVLKASIVTPNPTEAALLLGKHPRDYGVREDGTVSVSVAKDLLEDLSRIFPGSLAIVKSVVAGEGIGVSVRFSSDNTLGITNSITETILSPRRSMGSIGGTGDLFASLVVGNWLKQDLGRGANKTEIVGIIRYSVDVVSNIMYEAKRANLGSLPFRRLLSVSSSIHLAD